MSLRPRRSSLRLSLSDGLGKISITDLIAAEAKQQLSQRPDNGIRILAARRTLPGKRHFTPAAKPNLAASGPFIGPGISAGNKHKGIS